jgi:hypothetical protein
VIRRREMIGTSENERKEKREERRVEMRFRRGMKGKLHACLQFAIQKEFFGF